MHLGDRMKRYEEASEHKLLINVPVILRVDGRAFHTLTRGLKRPFDDTLMDIFEETMVETAKRLSGCKLAYHQSDEVTFLLTDFDSLETQAWFDYRLSKLCSITASTFTALFNKPTNNDLKLATFDCRAFNCPRHDVANVFVWRQRDWIRNSVSMLAQANFSHKQLQNKNQAAMLSMLKDIGQDWNLEASDREKFGTLWWKDAFGERMSANFDYKTINEILGFYDLLTD